MVNLKVENNPRRDLDLERQDTAANPLEESIGASQDLRREMKLKNLRGETEGGLASEYKGRDTGQGLTGTNRIPEANPEQAIDLNTQAFTAPDRNQTLRDLNANLSFQDRQPTAADLQAIEEAIAKSQSVGPDLSAIRADLQEVQPETTKSDMDQLLKKVEAYAKQQASQDFDNDPAKGPNEDRMEAKLREMIEKSGLYVDEATAEMIYEKYQDSYDNQHDTQFKEMNPLKRAYYSTKRWVKNRWSDAKKIAKGLVKLRGAVEKGAEWLVEKAKDPETWKTIAKGIEKARDWTIDQITDPENWKALGQGLVDGAVGAVKFGFTAMTNPAAAWEQVKDAWNSEFAKGMRDSLGITDMWEGSKRFIKGNAAAFTVLLTTGDVELAKAHALDAAAGLWQGTKGLVNGVGEVTGIKDACLTVKYGAEALMAYADGNELEAAMLAAQASMHGAFALASAGSIAATVSTGGAAVGTMVAVTTGKVAAKTALKQVAKQAFKQVGQQIGKDALEKVPAKQLDTAMESLVKETVEQSIKETEEAIVKETAEEVAKELTQETVEEITQKVAEEQAKAFMQSSGLNQQITDSTLEMLEKIDKHGMTNKQIQKLLMKEMGLEKAAAKEAATQMKKALMKGTADDEIAKALADGASKEITEFVYKKTANEFNKQYREALMKSPVLSKAAREQAKKMGKSVDEFADELTEAAAKGYKEGLEKGIRESVEKAIKQALKQFRTPKKTRFSGAGVGGVASAEELAISRSDEEDLAEAIAEGEAMLEQEAQQEVVAQVVTEHRVVNGVRVAFHYEIVNGEKRLTGSEALGSTNIEMARAMAEGEAILKQEEEELVAATPERVVNSRITVKD